MFCTKCGAVVDEKTGICPNCGACERADKKAEPRAKQKMPAVTAMSSALSP